jgi:hypothetical protein
MKGIPYGAIGEGIAFILIVAAFIEAEAEGRVFLAASYLLTFLAQGLFPSRGLSLICHIARLMIGAGSFIYLKYQSSIGSR